MVSAWGPTALLAIAVAVLAERGLTGRLGVTVDCAVAGAGALTVGWGLDLSWVTVAVWVVVAAVAGDQVARVAGRPSGRDPFHLLARTVSPREYAWASLVSAGVWGTGLVLGGWAVGGLLDRVVRLPAG